tara:strand:- start:9476 stop:9838 length:363 start_codon:yes stop_codon:yes gene_type:complete
MLFNTLAIIKNTHPEFNNLTQQIKTLDLYNALDIPIEQEIDFTVLSIPDIHQELPFKSPKFRAGYFSFVFIKDGSGFYTLDENEFPFSPKTIYFTNPGHIKSYEIITSNDAYIITFTENF